VFLVKKNSLLFWDLLFQVINTREPIFSIPSINFSFVWCRVISVWNEEGVILFLFTSFVFFRWLISSNSMTDNVQQKETRSIFGFPIFKFSRRIQLAIIITGIFLFFLSFFLIHVQYQIHICCFEKFSYKLLFFGFRNSFLARKVSNIVACKR
jgi:hypothetical protein